MGKRLRIPNFLRLLAAAAAQGCRQPGTARCPVQSCRKLRSLDGMRRHVVSHGGRWANWHMSESAWAVGAGPVAVPFLCPASGCDQFFLSSSALKRHRLAVHASDLQKDAVFRCVLPADSGQNNSCACGSAEPVCSFCNDAHTTAAHQTAVRHPYATYSRRICDLHHGTPACAAKFSSPLQLAEHVANVHSLAGLGGRVLICPSCKASLFLSSVAVHRTHCPAPPLAFWGVEGPAPQPLPEPEDAQSSQNNCTALNVYNFNELCARFAPPAGGPSDCLRDGEAEVLAQLQTGQAVAVVLAEI